MRTPKEILELIDAAEHTMFACGLLVDMAQDELDKAQAAKFEARNKVMELRRELIASEANHAA